MATKMMPEIHDLTDAQYIVRKQSTADNPNNTPYTQQSIRSTEPGKNDDIKNGYEHQVSPENFPRRPQNQKYNGSERKIFVGGLNYGTTNEELFHFFQDVFGPVSDSKVVKNREGQSRGFGFIVFEEESSAIAAVRARQLDCFGAIVDIRASNRNQPPLGNHHGNHHGNHQRPQYEQYHHQDVTPNFPASNSRRTNSYGYSQNMYSHHAASGSRHPPAVMNPGAPLLYRSVRVPVYEACPQHFNHARRCSNSNMYSSDYNNIIVEAPANAKRVKVERVRDTDVICETFKFLD